MQTKHNSGQRCAGSAENHPRQRIKAFPLQQFPTAAAGEAMFAEHAEALSGSEHISVRFAGLKLECLMVYGASCADARAVALEGDEGGLLQGHLAECNTAS